MPNTKYLQLKINNQVADIGDIEQFGLVINYILEEPENFLSKQASDSLGLTLPATRANDAIFNQFWSPQTQDMSPDGSFREWMDIEVYANGVIILKGSCLLVDATITDKPESYTINIYGNSGGWLIDAQNLTLWDCVSSHTHTFDVPTVETSWTYGNPFNPFTEVNDYCYFPVRYRQPFTTNIGPVDTSCNIYHLRPHISIYWLIIRGFQQLGYTVNSQFFNTPYFQGLVLLYTHGSFYDIQPNLLEGISFKAAGDITDVAANEPPPTTGFAGTLFWSGTGSGTLTPSAHGSSWIGSPSGGLTPGGGTILPTGGEYVFTGNIHTNNHFRMINALPPNGFDNFGLYSFDDTTGTMSWTYNPPPQLTNFFGNNITANFQLNLLLVITSFVSDNCMMAIEVTHIFASGAPTTVNNMSIMPSGGALVGATHYPVPSSYPLIPTVFNFPVNNISTGDVLNFRLRALNDGGGTSPNFLVFQAGYINTNPSVTGASTWQYNFTTEQYANINDNVSDNIWQQAYSYITLTNLQLSVGGTVDFKNYDAFKNYKFTDFLGGIVDAFNLEVQTDAINNVVTFEPMFGGTLPDGTAYDGYFSMQKILDYTAKRDRNKGSKMSLFSNMERQIDMQMRLDGSNGGSNIWAARYKGIYLNNITNSKINNTNIDNGIIAGVPGASRYMLPNRYAKGNKQITNRFFSSVMHYKHQNWANVTVINSAGTDPALAPQLICIFPENISDSSASAVTQIFQPQMAFYAGQQAMNGVGGWRFQGDPFGRGIDANGVGIPTYNSPSDVVNGQPLSTISSLAFNLPYAFAVDYSGYVATVPGQVAPVLNYSDENINGAQVKGLMSQFYLQRLAIMRNGQLYMPNLRLNLNDICNWEHREALLIENSFYALIGIEEYNPLSDESCQCTMWRIVLPEQIDLANCFPSSTSILTNPPSLSQFDLRYAPLMLFYTDIPILG